MIESPLIDEIVSKAKLEAKSEATHKNIIRFLEGRFGPVPHDVENAVLATEDMARLDDLVKWAGACPDLAAFRARLEAKKAAKRGRRK
jgi:hypothetical protein